MAVPAGVIRNERSYKKTTASRFEEIVALLALYRPGPLDSGMHDQFVDRKHGKTPVTYPRAFGACTFRNLWVILYQEQVMEALESWLIFL